MGATFLLGAIAWALLGFLLLLNLLASLTPPVFIVGPSPSRIVAGGGAGTWMVMGIMAFLIVGVTGTAVTTAFYKHLEEDMAAPLTGWKNLLAWGHIALSSFGLTAGTLLMTYGGYAGGAVGISVASGGLGLTGTEASTFVHANILGPLSLPIGLLFAVALIGYLFGGIALVTGWFAARNTVPA